LSFQGAKPIFAMGSFSYLDFVTFERIAILAGGKQSDAK
jgi:hypothetical protein